MQPGASSMTSWERLGDPLDNAEAEYLNEKKITQKRAVEVQQKIEELTKGLNEVRVRINFEAGTLGLTADTSTRCITNVDSDSPAAKHGVQVGWYFVEVDGNSDQTSSGTMPSEVQVETTITFTRTAGDGELEAEKGRLLYLRQQQAMYKHIADILLKQYAAQEAKAVQTGTAFSEDEQKKLIDFYKMSTALLRSIRSAFDATIDAPNHLLKRVFNHFVSTVQTHPKTCGAFVFCGGVAGAAYGTGILGNLHLLGWLPFGLAHSWGTKLVVASCCTSVVAGLVAVCAIVAVEFAVWFVRECMRDDIDDATIAREKLNKEIDALKDKDIPLQELVDLRDIFERAFVHPFKEPAASDNCIICLEPFLHLSLQTVSACEDCDCFRATRAPGCRNSHFVHNKCLKKWAEESSSLKCTVCQQ